MYPCTHVPLPTSRIGYTSWMHQRCCTIIRTYMYPLYSHSAATASAGSRHTWRNCNSPSASASSVCFGIVRPSAREPTAKCTGPRWASFPARPNSSTPSWWTPATPGTGPASRGSAASSARSATPTSCSILA